MGPRPRSSGTAVPATPRTHRLEDGESLWVVAERHYGSGVHLAHILKHNPQITDPDLIPVGTVLELPPLPAPKKAKAVAREPVLPKTPHFEYRIQEGDTLWGLAFEYLADGDRWREIARLNPGVDVHRLPAGLKVRIPKSP